MEQTFETNGANFKPRSQVNYGVSYQAFDNMSVGLSWLYGRTAAVSLSFQTDPTTPSYPTKIAPTLPPVHVRTPQEQQQALEILLGPWRRSANGGG